MAGAPARFTFDLDLGTQNHSKSSVAESAMTELLAAARAEGHAAGIAEGQRAASAQAAKQLTAAAEQLARHAAGMAAALDDTRKQVIAEAVQVALTAARKLAGGLIAREPAAEIEALLADSLAGLEAVPHLVVRCHPELAEAVRDTATSRIQASGFAGRLVVLGEPDIRIGDARIEWADGGIVRDINAISEQIDEAVSSYFAARGIRSPNQGEAPDEH